MEDLSGRQLGPYQVVAPVGEGGMAAVFKAYQASMDRYVALKVLPRHLAQDAAFSARFQNEARVLARLQHPHILPVFDFGQQDDYAYIAMPLIETGSLADFLRGQPVSLSELRQIGAQLGDALDYAHTRGVVHRDVKPSNVLLDARGNCLLTDFGIAKMVEGASHLTATGALIGTPAYMSPEQGRGEVLDRRSDIYSLGVILYELAAGRVPFSADTPVAIIYKHIHDPLPPAHTLNPRLPPALERVIERALAKQREDRFQSAGELVLALEASLSPVPGAERRDLPTVIEPPPPPPARTAAGPPTPPPGAGGPPTGAGAGLAQPAPVHMTPLPLTAAPRAGLLVGSGLVLGGLLGGLLLLIAGIFCVSSVLPGLLNPGPATGTRSAQLAAATGTLPATATTRAATATASPTPTRPSPTPTRPTATPTVTRSPTPLPPTVTSVPVDPALAAHNATALAFGPRAGELAHEVDQRVEVFGSGVSLRDFAASAIFEVPSAAPWDIGLLFRDAGGNEQYRLTLESDGDWRVANHADDTTGAEVIRGVASGLQTAAGAENKVTVVALGEQGFFFLNGRLIGQFGLEARLTAGDVRLGTEMLTTNERGTGVTRFREFVVYRPVSPNNGSGRLQHAEGVVPNQRANISLRDFVAAATTTNPYVGDWDVGFLLRRTGSDTALRLIFSSSRRWYLYDRKAGVSNQVEQGTISRFNTAQDGTNTLLVLAHGSRAVVYVDGTRLLNNLDLSANLEAGDVAVGTGFFSGNSLVGSVTAFSDFAVLPIP